MAPKDRPKAKAKTIKRDGGPRALTLASVVRRIGGARLCYGEPIREGGRTIIPVARVRAVGGAGWGRRRDEDGGGGGGSLDAFPLGFIDLGPEGARFEPIEDPEALTRTLKVATTAAITLVTTLAGLRAAGAGRKLLGRGG